MAELLSPDGTTPAYETGMFLSQTREGTPPPPPTLLRTIRRYGRRGANTQREEQIQFDANVEGRFLETPLEGCPPPPRALRTSSLGTYSRNPRIRFTPLCKPLDENPQRLMVAVSLSLLYDKIVDLAVKCNRRRFKDAQIVQSVYRYRLSGRAPTNVFRRFPAVADGGVEFIHF